MSLLREYRNALAYLALIVAALGIATFLRDPVLLDSSVAFLYFLLLAASWNLLGRLCRADVVRAPVVCGGGRLRHRLFC